jgi:O-antigen/teichoic acid export membrane protein
MRSILRATAVLGGASVVNILISIVYGKITALLLGPSGFGIAALLQALVNFGTMLAGLGVASGLVRAGSRAIAEGDAHAEAVLRRAAWLISLTAALAALLLTVLFREPLSAFVLSRSGGGYWIALMGPAILLSVMAGVQGGAINARQRVSDLAKITIISALTSLGPSILLVWRLRESGVAPALLVTVAVNWLVSFAYYRRACAGAAPQGPLPRRQVVKAAGDLLRFGVPYTGSLLAGAGVVILIPVMVLHALGPDQVGMYRAANSLAVNYLSVLLAAMAQDYFPRVSAAPDDRHVIADLINTQLRLVLLVCGPVILLMLGLVPFLVPLLYSHQFDRASDLLEWQLISDLFKFATWTMSFVIMARLGGKAFLLTELAAGLLLLGGSWFGMQVWGLSGLGIASLVTGACAFAIAWGLLWARIRLTWTRENVVLFLVLAAAMAAVRALPAIGLQAVRSPVAITIAALAGAYSVRIILREMGGLKWPFRRPAPEEAVAPD